MGNYKQLFLLLNTFYQAAFRLCLILIERDLVLDFLVRRGIRLMLAKRLKEVTSSPLLASVTAPCVSIILHSCYFIRVS